MVTYSTDELRPGMIVASDIKTKTGQMLVQRGSVLSQQMIQHMRFYHIDSALILPNEVVPVHTIEEIEEPSYAKRIKESQEFIEFKETFTQSAEIFKNSMQDFINGDAKLDTDLMLSGTMYLFNENKSSFSMLDMLHNMRDLDDSTYVHSINVSVISRLIGMWMGLSDEDLDVLTLCGLLHDIGKAMIPDEIINKPGALTNEEFKIIKTHTTEGYRLLLQEDIDPRIKNTALMHHERYDGKGYPLGLSGERIDTFASIVSIADVYDALTADRCYRSGVCPFEVIAMFESEGLSRYNPRVIMIFLSHIAQTYVGNSVRLNDNRVGRLAFISDTQLTRPLIQLEDGSLVDLTKELDLYVEEII